MLEFTDHYIFAIEKKLINQLKIKTMKSIKLISVIVVTMVFLSKISYSQTIIASKHDFSAKSWNSTGEICKVCHIPHNANTAVTNAPLWNHQLTSTASFTLYSSGTLNATVGQPDASSKLCLSCHDGTVAIENFSGTTSGTTYMGTLGTPVGYANVGTDLSNDHPISFTYDAALATTDGGLNDPTTTASGLGGTISQKMLISGKVQCASCHDVHNGAGVTYLLKKSNAASALCLTCHKK